MRSFLSIVTDSLEFFLQKNAQTLNFSTVGDGDGASINAGIVYYSLP